jgi:hypothetical protein
MNQYKKFLGRTDLVKNQVEREKLAEQEASNKRKRSIQQQNKQRWLKYQEQLRSELAARYFHAVQSTGGESFSNIYSVEFDGTDDTVNMGNASELNFNHHDAFTLSVWVKRDSLGAAVIIDKMETSGTFTGYQLAFTSDKIRIYHRRQNQTYNRIYRITDATFTSTTEWYHIVSTYDGSRANTGLKIYVNGDEAASTGYNSMNAGAWTNNADFKIGRTTDGHIDEVSVYNSELSATDVASIYNGNGAGKPGDVTSLSPVGWWRMGDNDSGTGTTVTDQGSGGNNGSLIADATFEEDVPGS